MPIRQLSPETVNRIAGFISHSLLDKLEKQKLIERDHEENVRKSVASRLRSWRINEERLAELRTQELHASGRLTPDRIAHAIDTGRERAEDRTSA